MYYDFEEVSFIVYDINCNLKTILHYILDIFKLNVSHNILRIGLIELAELLNY